MKIDEKAVQDTVDCLEIKCFPLDLVSISRTLQVVFPAEVYSAVERCHIQVNTKHLYNICTMLDRRYTSVMQIVIHCCVCTFNVFSFT